MVRIWLAHIGGQPGCGMDDSFVPDSFVGHRRISSPDRAMCDLWSWASQSASSVFANCWRNGLRAMLEPSAVSLYRPISRQCRISPTGLAYATGPIESFTCRWSGTHGTRVGH